MFLKLFSFILNVILIQTAVLNLKMLNYTLKPKTCGDSSNQD